MKTFWRSAVSVLILCLLLPRFAEAQQYIEGEVLVRYRSHVGLKRASQVAQAKGLSTKRTYPTLSARRGQQIAVLKSDSKTTAELLADLQQNPDVDIVAPNYRRPIFVQSPPTDPRYRDLWGLHNTGQTVNASSGTTDADVDYPEAWRLSRFGDSTEIVVGVIDTGVDYEHPDLAANMWSNSGEIPWNGIDDDSNGYVDDYYGYDFAGDTTPPPDSDPMDYDTAPGHGTHVSGTIGAIRDNALGVAGVHPNVRIMALKASDDGNTIPDDASLAAIEYAAMMKDNGVNIVALNASYGGPTYNLFHRNAIRDAGLSGIIFCAAAGNDGTDNDTTPQYPAGYALDNIIAVAATDQDDLLASFSNYGDTTVDLAAPGVNILSTYPRHWGTEAWVVSTSVTWSAEGMTYAGVTESVTGIVYSCGLGYATSFPAEVAGNIALIERGTLTFLDKASNAVAAGATAAIIYNNVAPDNFLGTLQYPDRWIPVVALSQSDGQALQALGTTTVVVVNRMNTANAFGYLQGTSMATPHVTGATALMALNYPNDTVTGRIARLLNNVDVIPGLATRVTTSGRLNAAKPLDTDTDSLPDWWELESAASLTNMNETTDSDSDGLLDVDEYRAGTDATNHLDYLQVDADPASLTNASAYIVKWPSAQGRTYSVFRGSNLASGLSVLASNIAATPPENVYTDTTVSAESLLFYRIGLD